jgi:hypothetical protein
METSAWSIAKAIAFGIGLGTALPGQFGWSPRDQLQPSEVTLLAMHAGSGRAVLLGTDLTGPRTFTFDGRTWTPSTATTPDPYDAAMAYDEARDRVVLFGGTTGATWLWDGQAWTRATPRTTPPPRRDHALAFAPGLGRVVLFGGTATATGAGLTDTWTFDGVDWAPIASPGLAGRARHRLAWVASAGRLALFGGEDANGPRDDTWWFDGSTWTPFPASPRPSPRSTPAFTAAGPGALLFGGRDASGPRADLWYLDAGGWTLRDPRAQPPARWSAGMVFDAARQRVLLHGGETVPGPWALDTWTFDGVAWQRVADARLPYEMPVAYDERRGRAVGVGRGETWEWDGLAWVQRPAANAPAAQFAHALAYDSARRRVVCFGGFSCARADCALDTTHEWDGVSWATMAPTVRPAARGGMALAYDAARAQVVLFGGEDASGLRGDAHAYDGATWRALAGGPAPRAFAGMTYDPLRQVVVLFGGITATGPASDTWEWDGRQWSQRAPVTTPPARGSPQLAFDPVRGDVVMVGGIAGHIAHDDVWRFDGVDWVAQPLTGTKRTSVAALFFDASLRRVVGSGERVIVNALAHVVTTTHLLTDTPASSSTYATGCGSAAIPQVHAHGLPWLGNAGFALDLTSLPANAPVALLLAVNRGARDLGNGCTLAIDPAALLVMASASSDARGRVQFALPILRSGLLRSVPVYAQGAALERSSARGYTLTPGLVIRPGD